MPFLRIKLEDRFFLTAGLDVQDLEFNTMKLELQKDPEYEQMMKEYNAKLEKLYEQQ